MKHQLILDIDVEERSQFASKGGATLLLDFVTERAWKIEGIAKNGVTGRIVGQDVVIVSKAEYEQLRARIAHNEKTDGQQVPAMRGGPA